MFQIPFLDCCNAATHPADFCPLLFSEKFPRVIEKIALSNEGFVAFDQPERILHFEKEQQTLHSIREGAHSSYADLINKRKINKAGALVNRNYTKIVKYRSDGEGGA